MARLKATSPLITTKNFRKRKVVQNFHTKKQNFDIKPCCIKLRRIKPGVTAINQNKENAQKDNSNNKTLNEFQSIDYDDNSSEKCILDSVNKESFKQKNLNENEQQMAKKQNFKNKQFCIKVRRIKFPDVAQNKENAVNTPKDKSDNKTLNEFQQLSSEYDDKSTENKENSKQNKNMIENEQMASTSLKMPEVQNDHAKTQNFKTKLFCIKVTRIKLPDDSQNKEPSVEKEHAGNVPTKESCTNNTMHQFQELSSVCNKNSSEECMDIFDNAAVHEKNSKERKKGNVNKINVDSSLRKNLLNKKSGRISKSKQVRPSQVYNFSQESIVDHDPAADIIKKLIKQKKVRVATAIKGKGRVRMKPAGKKNVKTTQQKVMPDKSFDQLKNECSINNNNDEPILNDADISHLESPDDVQHDTLCANQTNPNVSINTSSYQFAVPTSPLVTYRTFSELEQSRRTYSPQKKMPSAGEMLNIVRKIVSTPINSKLGSLSLSTIANLSDISLPGTVMELPNDSPRPWRMDITRGSGMNYVSSDNSNKQTTITNKKDETNNNTIIMTPQRQNEVSLNHSNAENISPPVRRKDTRPRNELLLSLRQQANPLAGRPNRSPLKALNILEVVNLPPWKPIEKPNSNRQSVTTIQNLKNIQRNNKTKDSLFGFEEFMEEGADSIQMNTSTENSFNTTNNQTLSEQLKRFKKWRPKVTKTKTPAKETQLPMSNLFNIREETGKKQRCIKEMLCSTMINPTANEAGRQLGHDKVKDKRETMNLFKDAEETTFTEDEPHRTYIKPYKRKRKLRQNLVMYWDSDESGEEDAADERIENMHLHKHKYQRKAPTSNPEIDEFARQFNEMCKEVENSEIIIEKET